MENLSDYQEKIQTIAKTLPAEKLLEVLDFMEFLSQKDKGFDYTMTEDSADYVRSLREKESITKDGKQKDGQGSHQEFQDHRPKLKGACSIGVDALCNDLGNHQVHRTSSQGHQDQYKHNSFIGSQHSKQS